jgi:hypothetical protein
MMKPNEPGRRVIALGTWVLLVGVAAFIVWFAKGIVSMVLWFPRIASEGNSTPPAIVAPSAIELALICGLCAGPGLACIALGVVMFLRARSAPGRCMRAIAPGLAVLTVGGCVVLASITFFGVGVYHSFAEVALEAPNGPPAVIAGGSNPLMRSGLIGVPVGLGCILGGLIMLGRSRANRRP